MQATYITEFTEGSRVDATLFLRSREMRSTRAGEAYLALDLGDRTGSIRAVYFRPSPEASAIPAGTPVRVRGTVTRFKGARRISIEGMVPARHWDVGDLIGSTTRARDEFVAEFNALARSVGHAGLRRALRAAFSEADFRERFYTCPASESQHHAHLNGLLEHTVAVAAMCADAAERYDGVDRDLLVTAALLHDIGTVDELIYEAGIGYSHEGRLVGHVVLGDVRVRRAAERARLDSELRLRLEHAVLSHHRGPDTGSPAGPATFEALLLHHIDSLDTQAAGFAAALKGASRVEETWTDAENRFRRPLYVPRAEEAARLGRGADGRQRVVPVSA